MVDPAFVWKNSLFWSAIFQERVIIIRFSWQPCTLPLNPKFIIHQIKVWGFSLQLSLLYPAFIWGPARKYGMSCLNKFLCVLTFYVGTKIWLTTDQSKIWLTTDQSKIWLTTDQSKIWLTTDQSKIWLICSCLQMTVTSGGNYSYIYSYVV